MKISDCLFAALDCLCRDTDLLVFSNRSIAYIPYEGTEQQRSGRKQGIGVELKWSRRDVEAGTRLPFS